MIIDGLVNEMESKLKQQILDRIKKYKVTSKEIYNWLVINQNNYEYSNSFVLLGDFNRLGIETNVDLAESYEFYKKAANLGNAFGTNRLVYFNNNYIVTRSINKKI
jgi:TPR repeat protein